MASWLPPLLLGGTLAIATVWDVRTRQVPLWLTVGSVVAGVAFASVRGVATLTASGLGLAAGLGVSLPLVLLGGLGPADALLLGAVGAWEGWHFALWAAWWTSAVGAAVAVVVCRRRPTRTFAYVPAIAAGVMLAAAVALP